VTLAIIYFLPLLPKILFDGNPSPLRLLPAASVTLPPSLWALQMQGSLGSQRSTNIEPAPGYSVTTITIYETTEKKRTSDE